MPNKTESKQENITAIGRRKTAVARIKLTKGSGKIFINEKEIANPSRVYTEPLKITDNDDKLDVFVKVSGGGLTSREGAIRLAVARALDKLNPELHKTLKVEGFLTRDSRMKERKKPGLKGARKAPQWAKR
ncbi:MAG: 30S ribosomal protein S9 [Berkelbacteria bacterium GW2011_GWB1_38_5]|uniref:Small ribosomal subunit protein uS9 n=2 Tax=Candidatus Berkelbacteria TaxID=1618330 RepID=A0A0G0NYJ7_9BACT|nr:MAG: 30S ribosomal protein S9 [Berkelbacteria bacterium GW2011_GWB1_38_5]KKQ90944.1 MAG: 30S ribosomal protein S9 [Berkelbacteria bacterium GW2011_GWA1_39_10]